MELAPAVRAWAMSAVSVLLIAVGAGLTIADGLWTPGGDIALGCVVGIGNALLGGFVLTRHPGNVIGWVFAATGLSRAIAVGAQGWCVHALVTAPGTLPGGALASWLQAWAVLPGIALVPLLVGLFPDGRLPGRRWRVIPAFSAVSLILLGVVVPAGMWPYRGPRLLPEAPVPDTTAAHVVVVAMVAGLVSAVAAILVALAGLLVRARGARGDVRQQTKWFGYGAVCGLVLNFAGGLPGLGWVRLLGAVSVLTGIGLGIFRYRLYDVDRLINRTLVYGLVTGMLVASFAALDVSLAVVVGSRSVAVAAISAFVVALLLRPARERAQDLVDRVFDRRVHDAVTALRTLGQRVGREPVEPDRVVAALRHALRDPDLTVLFSAGDGTFADGDGRIVPVVPAAGRVADPVLRDGETIAVLLHDGGEPVLLQAVREAGAAAIEHARLQAVLRVQLAEVRASRARIVAAGDAERRRIERDLHDGAQQRLVGLALHVQSAKRRSHHPPDVVDLLTFTADQLRDGVEEIRRLVHGIMPPALATGGLPAALDELAVREHVRVTHRLAGRLDPGIESAAWFVACEGVANAAKHAPDRPVHVEAAVDGGLLVVRVSDTGPGGADPAGHGLRNLADRVEAHGGTLTVEGAPGTGTRLTAELPCES